MFLKARDTPACGESQSFPFASELGTGVCHWVANHPMVFLARRSRPVIIPTQSMQMKHWARRDTSTPRNAMAQDVDDNRDSGYHTAQHPTSCAPGPFHVPPRD